MAQYLDHDFESGLAKLAEGLSAHQFAKLCSLNSAVLVDELMSIEYLTWFERDALYKNYAIGKKKLLQRIFESISS